MSSTAMLIGLDPFLGKTSKEPAGFPQALFAAVAGAMSVERSFQRSVKWRLYEQTAQVMSLFYNSIMV